MSSANKRAAQVVVRPLARGSRSASKVILGTMGELNHHAPAEGGQKPDPEPKPKPWKQASRSYPRFRAGKVLTRRNAGRDDGRTWLAGRYVCGVGLEAEWSDDGDEDGDEVEEREGWMEDEEERTGWAEVAIMDIAKPMRPRGPMRDYEVVNTARRVVVLEDEWEWVGDVASGKKLDDGWEPIEAMACGRASYATVVQRQIS